MRPLGTRLNVAQFFPWQKGLAISSLVVLASGLLCASQARTEPVSNGPIALRRLTELQYQNIIRDVFGTDITIGGRFDPGIRQEGLLEVGAGRASISASGLAQYVSMARSVAAQVLDTAHRTEFVACKPKVTNGPDEACARRFLAETGLLLYRRPIADAELKELVGGTSATALTLHDFYAGLETALATMLQSPEFLFRWEIREGSGKNKGQLDAYSKASRMSFFLWNTSPDPRLLEAARKGELNTQNGIAREVDRMLASPRLEEGVRAFFYDMLILDTLPALAKDAKLYPKYSFKVAADAEEQMLRTIVDVVLTQQGDYRDIFTTRKTFLNRRLGAIYDVPIVGVAEGGTPDGWQAYEFPPGDPRAGILAEPAFVALHSHPGRTSPTLRGRALREAVLCQKIPDPPGNVDQKIVQDTTNAVYKTVRQRLSAHATEAMCTGCHKLVDPIGLAMENFDTIGAFRTKENGAAIDASGILDGTKFADAAGLAKAVHDHPAVPACLVNRMYAYGVGRSPSKTETSWLTSEEQKAFADSGFRIVPLLRQIVLSNMFFLDSPPPDALPQKAGAVSTQAASLDGPPRS